MGTILGTAAYMAPEQAKGRAVDKRADIWAFGVVLFEMLTGRPLFAGDSVAETIGFVTTREPDWATLPPDVPPAVISPDGKWVAFNDEGDFTLRKVPISGRPSGANRDGRARDRGRIVGPGRHDRLRIQRAGIGPHASSRRGDLCHRPDDAGQGRRPGRPLLARIPAERSRLIYTARAGERGGQYQVWALDLQSGASHRLVETGTGARYSASGHLIYGVDNALWAVRFDAATLQTRGDPVRIVDGVDAKDSGAVDVAVSTDGSLAYVTSAGTSAPRPPAAACAAGRARCVVHASTQRHG